MPSGSPAKVSGKVIWSVPSFTISVSLDMIADAVEKPWLSRRGGIAVEEQQGQTETNTELASATLVQYGVVGDT
jgi:hypothetical protein